MTALFQYLMSNGPAHKKQRGVDFGVHILHSVLVIEDFETKRRRSISNERETKWLRIGDADVCLLHDVCGFDSEIEVTFDDGKVVGFPVGTIDKDGLPSDGGLLPTLADLERLGTLLATYSRPLGALGVDGKCRIALEMNSNLVEDSPGFAWLSLLKEAEEHGIHIGVDRPSAPSKALTA